MNFFLLQKNHKKKTKMKLKSEWDLINDQNLHRNECIQVPVEIEQALPALGFKVLDVLGFIQNEVPPRLAPKSLMILQY